jgi:hypothetical protein
MKNVIFFIFILTLTNCRYFNVSPVNGITFKDLTEKPRESEIIGTWALDKFSYDAIQNKGIKKEKVSLKFNNDKTFEVQNFPNIFDFDENNKIIKSKGIWKISKNFEGKNWVLNMEFGKTEDFISSNVISTDFELYLQDNKLIIWYFIGDPDSGDRFLFTKK